MPLGIIYSRVYYFSCRQQIFGVEVKFLYTSVDIAALEIQKVSTVEAVLELSVEELKQQLDLYEIDTKGLVNNLQLQKALLRESSVKDKREVVD